VTKNAMIIMTAIPGDCSIIYIFRDFTSPYRSSIINTCRGHCLLRPQRLLFPNMSQSFAYAIAKAARTAFEECQLIPALERIKALEGIKNALASSKAEILAANQKDLEVWPDLV
jgi:hypothetical protein